MNTKQMKQLNELMPNVGLVANGFQFWKKRLLLKIIDIFKYDNLPDTCNETALRKQILTRGFCVFVDDPKYGICHITGSRYGVALYEDADFLPYFVSDNVLVHGNYEIDKDCYVLYNDSLHIGYDELINRYARILADSDSTFSKTLYLMRRPNFFNTEDEKSAASIKASMDANELGVDKIILGKDIMSDISALSQAPHAISPNILTEQIMARNSVINMFLREFGIRCVDEKKERINEAEINDSNTNISIIWDMLNTQTECLNKINDALGTNITVRLSDNWEYLIKEPEEEEPAQEEMPAEEPIEEMVEDEPAEEMTEEAAEEEPVEEPVEEIVEEVADAIEEIVEEVADAITEEEPQEDETDGNN